MKACARKTHNPKGILKLFKRLRLPAFSWVKIFTAIAESDRGAELFEFALVAPLLLALLLGIVWMGRAYNVYATITRAAREGVRYAVLPNSYAAGNTYADTPTTSCSSNTNAFNNYVVPVLKADSLDPSKVLNYCQQAVYLENTYPQQCGVVIKFSYPLQLEIPFTTLRATTIDIPVQAQMRLENQPSGGCP